VRDLGVDWICTELTLKKYIPKVADAFSIFFDVCIRSEVAWVKAGVYWRHLMAESSPKSTNFPKTV
jgi:hypothetical protein